MPLTTEQQSLRTESYEVVLDLLAKGEFQVDIGRTFPLAEAADAHRLIETAHPAGKPLLIP
nr:zinc-binding dehydrogenase [Leifsonia poae]